MERLLAVWIDELSQERADGSALRTFATVVEALVGVSPFIDPIRLGLLVLPLRGPSRFFGGDAAVLDAVRTTVGDIAGVRPRLGVAEGLFCAELAARQEVVVAAGETTAFRRAQLLDVLGNNDLATTGRRLGFATVGAFADLSPGHVAERFSGSVRVLHRVARGELSELPSQRDRRLGRATAHGPVSFWTQGPRRRGTGRSRDPRGTDQFRPIPRYRNDRSRQSRVP